MKTNLFRAQLAVLFFCSALAAQAGEVDFARDIQPILADKCTACHGPDEANRAADLRLDDASAIDDGAIEPGDPDASELIARVTSSDAEEVMPPPEHKNPVTKDEIELLRKWIEEGAEYQTHWAYTAPVRSEVPEGKNLVDTFVHAKLQQENLEAAPEADRAAVLRRLSLDLTGLPPTLEELDAFLADESPDAYEKQVERLLASSHYGERWARWWLDAARYADSDGFEKDLPRQQWAWRDWVIGALNRDLPYNQFIVHQLAGDLLPGAGQDERVATGFLRNSMVNEEGAILAEEFRIESVIDRIDCVGKAVLGMSLSCGQCHDHKYDPFTQREYYQIFAFLNNDYEAVQRVYSADHRKEMDRIEREVQEQEAKIKKAIPEWKTELAKWTEQEVTKLRGTTWSTLHPTSAEVPDGITHPDILEDGTVLSLGFRPTATVLTVMIDTKNQDMTALKLEALNHGDLIFGGPGRNRHGMFAISEMSVRAASLAEPDKFEKVEIAEATADVGKPEGLIDPYFRHHGEDRRLIGGARFLVDGDQKTAWYPDRDPRWRNEESEAVLRFKQPVSNAGGTRFRIALVFRHGGGDSHGRKNNFLGRFRLSTTSGENPQAGNVPAESRRALSIADNKRTSDDERILLRQWARSHKDANKFTKQIDKLWSEWPVGDSVLNLADRSQEFPRRTFIFERGNWQKPTDEVTAGVPAAFHPLPENAPPNRLTFANWLVDRRSPLTARVIVNRVWQEYFGTGLCATSEDIGVRSELPTHPKLLDTLSVELMEPSVKTGAAKPAEAWSLKHLHRVIVTSATYRQSSRATAEMLKRDPNNLLLARGPRFRGNAEMIRDIALTASGLLTRDVGGPSIFPPAPKGLFALSFVNVDFWNTATGPDRYRRSLYVFRRRSIPDPVMSSFDAPTGDISCVRRVMSNTPLAALTGLNATIFTEAAQALALRVLREGGQTDEQRIQYGFRLCTARLPSEKEAATIAALLQRTRERLASGELQAADIAFNEFTKPGDLPPNATPNEAAVWTVLARVLLNLDATLSKG